MDAAFSDDMRQAVVIARNEIRKFARGKKLILYVALIGFIVALMTFVPYLLGGSLGDTPVKVASGYIGFIDLIVILAAVLFSSTSIVSEFEERTALILFTKPVRKYSIFIGKFIASFVIVFVSIVVYYLFTAIVSLVVAGGVTEGLGVSFGLATAYLFAMVSVSLIFSAIFKKGSTASIMTLVFLLLILPMIEGILIQANLTDCTWIILNGTDLTQSFTEPAKAESLRSLAVMLVWGLLSLAASYALFKRRDF